MAQRSARNPAAERLSRLALIEREEKREHDLIKVTPTSPSIRLVIAGAGGILLWAAQTNALLAWVGAAAFMISVAGAEPGIGAAAGAIATAIAYFRLLSYVDATGAFWLTMLLYAGAGAIAGAFASIMSKRLPPAAFAFAAALLPAGMEQLGSFGLTADLGSTALTQYLHPFIVRMSRPGGLAGVTYVIFVFGGAAAMAVRYIREPSVVVVSSLPALGLVLVGFIYGAATSAATSTSVAASVVNFNDESRTRSRLFSRGSYDAAGWNGEIQTLSAIAASQAGRQIIQTAIERQEGEVNAQLMVWPEAVVALNSETKKAFLGRLAGFDKASKCVQVAGFYDVDASASKLAVTTDSGPADESYSRMRYVHGVDDNLYGIQICLGSKVTPKATSTRIGKIGALLSIDALYFHNFKALAQTGAGLVAVSGYDDAKPPRAGLRMLVYNAARAGVSVVRSTGAGMMAFISPNGAIVARDTTAPAANSSLTERVAVGSGDTIALVVGSAFGWLALLAGIAAGLFASTLSDTDKGPAPRRGEYGPLTYRTKEGTKEV